MENIILKCVAMVCITAIAVVTLIANKDDEEVAGGVWIFVIISLAIIFIPWEIVCPAIF